MPENMQGKEALAARGVRRLSPPPARPARLQPPARAGPGLAARRPPPRGCWAAGRRAGLTPLPREGIKFMVLEQCGARGFSEQCLIGRF